MPIRNADQSDANYGTVETREKQGSGLNAVRLTLTTGPNSFASVKAGCVGQLRRIVISPDLGAEQPIDQWDLTITDEDGDIIYSVTNLSNSTITIVDDTTPKCVYGLLTFLMENAGALKTATIAVYFTG